MVPNFSHRLRGPRPVTYRTRASCWRLAGTRLLSVRTGVCRTPTWQSCPIHPALVHFRWCEKFGTLVLLSRRPWFCGKPRRPLSPRPQGFRERVRLLLSVLSSVLGLLVSFSLLLVLLDSWSLLGGPGGRWDLAPLLGSRPPSPLVLRVTGMTLAAGSVLLAGPRR